jgi:polysaccharide export outer membrane protein
LAHSLHLSCALSVLMLTPACTAYDTPDNIEAVATGDAYQAQYRDPAVTRQNAMYLRSEPLNAQKCLPLGGVDAAGASLGKGSTMAASILQGERLTRNDLLDVRVGDDPTFSGSYVVSRDGTLKLPFLDPIQAQGRSTSEVEADILRGLHSKDFYADTPQLSVRVTDFASVNVAVSGAVFEPHAVEIGGVMGDRLDVVRQTALGASTEGRNLSAALRGVFEGQNAVDIMLLSGDEIRVPSRQCFQEDLMRPSPISPPGVSLFLSNLTQPATNNASSAIGQTVREVPYGTRYLQAVIDANCVGGPRSTSADRSSVLFTRNPITGVSAVIERDIEDLLRRADRDDYDPYLLPGDALACYDSTVTNIAEIGRIFGVLGAATLLAR